METSVQLGDRPQITGDLEVDVHSAPTEAVEYLLQPPEVDVPLTGTRAETGVLRKQQCSPPFCRER